MVKTTHILYGVITLSVIICIIVFIEKNRKNKLPVYKPGMGGNIFGGSGGNNSPATALDTGNKESIAAANSDTFKHTKTKLDVCKGIDMLWSDLFGQFMGYNDPNTARGQDGAFDYDHDLEMAIYLNGYGKNQFRNPNFTKDQEKYLHQFIDKVYTSDGKGNIIVLNENDPNWTANALKAFQEVCTIWIEDNTPQVTNKGMLETFRSEIGEELKNNGGSDLTNMVHNMIATSYRTRMYSFRYYWDGVSKEENDSTVKTLVAVVKVVAAVL